MPVTYRYPSNTQTGPGTGGTIYDMASGFTISFPQNTGSTSSTSFVEMISWQVPMSASATTGSHPYSISINAVNANALVRFRLQRVNSSNAVQESSSYTASFNTTGIKTGTFTLSGTWNTGDRLRLSCELMRASGHGNVNATLDVNSINTVIDFDYTAVTRRIFVS